MQIERASQPAAAAERQDKCEQWPQQTMKSIQNETKKRDRNTTMGIVRNKKRLILQHVRIFFCQFFFRHSHSQSELKC